MTIIICQVAPSIFTQVFTILGSIQDNPQGDRPPKHLALPFVYALLSSKQTVQYRTVLQAVSNAATEFGIDNCYPGRIMTDFELSIINASTTIFPEADVSCCYFHFKQSLYRKVQNIGLQIPYNDPDDREVKIFVHMTAALAFIPVPDVVTNFQRLKNQAPAVLHEFIEYFELTYIGITARGRRAAQRPRYEVNLWNQYETVCQGLDTTNNVSEGWHNRFRIVVAKHHPDLYSALQEFRKEQGDTEVKILELSQGKSITDVPKKKWYESKQRLRRMVEKYPEHNELGTVMDYLRGIAHTIILD